MSNTIEELDKILEAAIFAAGEPVSVSRLGQLFAENERPNTAQLRAALETLQQHYAERGVLLVEVASGFRFQAKTDYAPWIKELWQKRPPRYSRALLETLALIAYKQPITRAEIEEVRGVAVSSDIMKKLMDREWIKIVGHKDVPGKPALFATTKEFLDYFNLKNLAELPELAEPTDLDELEAKLNEQLHLPVGGAQPECVQDTVEQADQLATDDVVEDEAVVAMIDADDEAVAEDEVVVTTQTTHD